MRSPSKLVKVNSAEGIMARTLAASSPAKLRRALLEEGLRSFRLVFRPGAESEIGSFEQQAFVLALLHSLVRRFDGEFHRDGRVGGDLFQDLLGVRNQIRGRDDSVYVTDTMSLLRADHLSGENELERPSLPHQSR